MDPRYPHPLIAREGWPFLGLAVAVALALTAFGGWWSLPLWLVALFVLQFFRDPPRPVPAGERLVLAPADGRVIAVLNALDPYAGREALKISVFMNVFNVHSNRAPIDGTVERVTYFPGRFVNADLDKASEHNERNALLIRATDGSLVSCVQVAGLIARRVLCYVAAGDRLARGQRFGFIRFGSRVDVYLPLTARPRVAIGEKVHATVSVLAELAAPAGSPAHG
ncbi:MAG: phosphatidylserine decarboxylase [Burkholderiaceae bacterium]|nr:phosphatidylserine decarboxylase [Burkholderiaceae bacterium]MEB2351284.1 phosphatidylserine decarboxylase [Burkholderiaceae bacterium]